MATTDSTLLKLALDVKAITEDIVAHLSSKQHPEPSFAASSPDPPNTPEYGKLRASLNDAASDLLQLVNGPGYHYRSFLVSHTDLSAFQVALEFDFFNLVPLEGTLDVQALANKSGLDEDRTGRIMRFLAVRRIFEEVNPGIFTHTAGSALFQKDPELKAAGEYQLDEFFKASSELATCFKNSPHESDSVHSAFSTRHGVPLFQYYQQNPPLAARFAKAMAGVAKLDRQVVELVKGFPWPTLTGGKVVDVGGGSGHVSMILARTFPNLEIVVQDRAEMLAQGKAMDLSDLNGRVTFMEHNFFEAQPEAIDNAGAFFIRQILHNWNDRDCIKILKGIVPALERCPPKTPLLINDAVVPEPGTHTRYEEHGLRQLDIMMLMALGAKQRTEAEFRTLLAAADPRFEVVQVHGTSTMGLLEVHLQRKE